MSTLSESRLFPIKLIAVAFFVGINFLSKTKFCLNRHAKRNYDDFDIIFYVPLQNVNVNVYKKRSLSSRKYFFNVTDMKVVN